MTQEKQNPDCPRCALGDGSAFWKEHSFWRDHEKRVIDAYKIETLRHAANAIFNKLNEAYHCGMQTDQGRNALFDAQALADVIVRSESATSLIGPNAKGEPTAMTPGSAN